MAGGTSLVSDAASRMSPRTLGGSIKVVAAGSVWAGLKARKIKAQGKRSAALGNKPKDTFAL